jgi:hypothetical protein
MAYMHSVAAPLHPAVHNIHHNLHSYCYHTAAVDRKEHHTVVGFHIPNYILLEELGLSWALPVYFCDDDGSHKI